jgi:hypothetical protein
VTAKSTICCWDMLYKSGVYVPTVTWLTPGDLRTVRGGLRPKRFGLTGAQESAEGIVPRPKARLVRHSKAEEAEQQIGGSRKAGTGRPEQEREVNGRRRREE